MDKETSQGSKTFPCHCFLQLDKHHDQPRISGPRLRWIEDYILVALQNFGLRRVNTLILFRVSGFAEMCARTLINGPEHRMQTITAGRAKVISESDFFNKVWLGRQNIFWCLV